MDDKQKDFRVNNKEWDKDVVMEHVCDELATSSRGLGNIIKNAREDFEEFPNYSTIMKWLSEDKQIAERYACAREAQADFMADEILDISDDGRNDWMTRESKSGEEYEVTNKEAIQRSRLRVDTRKWLASKLKPKKYGEKFQAEIKGELGFAAGMKKIRDAIGSNPDLEKQMENEMSD